MPRVEHSRSQQRTESTYIEIFSPKKTGFSPVKNTAQNFFDFFLTLLFSADATKFSKKQDRRYSDPKARNG